MPTPTACSLALIRARDADPFAQSQGGSGCIPGPLQRSDLRDVALTTFYCFHPHRRPDPVEPGAMRPPAYGPFASLGSLERDLHHTIEGVRTFIREIESGLLDRPTRRTGAPFPVAASRPGWSKCDGRLTYRRRIQQCAGLRYL